MNPRTSIHHRRCRSNGGNNNSRNLLKCDPKRHEAFHTLFADWEAPQIVGDLNYWVDGWKFDARKRSDVYQKDFSFQMFTEHTPKKQQAFNKLFGRMTVEQIVTELNQWIDPDWEVVINKRGDNEHSHQPFIY